MNSANPFSQQPKFSTPLKTPSHDFFRKTEQQKTPKFKNKTKNAKLNSEYAKNENLKHFKKNEEDAFELANDIFEDFESRKFKSPFAVEHRNKCLSSKSTEINNSMNESPFCKLLNDSEMEPIEKYQILSSKNSKKASEGTDKQTFLNFFEFFNEKKDSIVELFSKEAFFEIVGEELHSIDLTIQAISNYFEKFLPDIKNERPFNYDDIAFEKNEESYVLTITGNIIGSNFNVSNFIMSCKFDENNRISFAKIKID